MYKNSKHSRIVRRLLKHMTQVELAKKLGCKSQSRISDYKNGKTKDCAISFYEKMVKLENKLKVKK